MTQRNLFCSGDQLLDPELHPVGSRLLLARRSIDASVYETTIVEWAPSRRRVKLSYESGRTSWVECWDYDPVVIEVLQP